MTQRSPELLRRKEHQGKICSQNRKREINFPIANLEKD